MGLTFIFIIAAAVGLVLALNCYLDFWEDLGLFLSAIGLVGLSVCIMIVIFVQIPRERDYIVATYERSALEYRLENEGLEGNEMLHSDIIEFNKSLYTKKYHTGRFMTGWFVNSRIAEGLDYIDIGEGVVPNGQ